MGLGGKIKRMGKTVINTTYEGAREVVNEGKDVTLAGTRKAAAGAEKARDAARGAFDSAAGFTSPVKKLQRDIGGKDLRPSDIVKQARQFKNAFKGKQ